MSHGLYGHAAGVQRTMLARERVADAIRGAIELLARADGSLDSWQVHHLTLAASYARMGMFQAAMKSVACAAEPHLAKDAARPAPRSAGLYRALDQLEDAIIHAR